MAIGPAKTVNVFEIKLALLKKLCSLSFELFFMFSGKLEAFVSPKNFTYPPRGMAAICQTVPRLSFLEKSLGPIPTEKTSA